MIARAAQRSATLTVVTATAVLVSSCAAHRSVSQVPPAAPVVNSTQSLASSASDMPSRYGTSAAALADMVPGCDSAATLTPHAALNAAPALKLDSAGVGAASSIIRCTLRGAGVLVLAFAARSAEVSAANAVYQVESYFSGGPGWIAVATSAAGQVADLSVVQGVAQALGGTLYKGRMYRSQP
jgi:hypothetical protein